MVRFANSVLKWLCSRATAPTSAISAASRNALSLALRPVRLCSASIARHGFVVPPPRLDLSTAAGDLQIGAALFGQRCSGCHGATGRGDGKAASSLLPHPADLTAARFSSRRLADVLWNGVPGTAMPPFRDVPLRDLRAIASHVARFGSGPGGRDGEARLARTDGRTEAGTLGEAGAAYGSVLFRVRCAVCHGAEGYGDGPAAARLRRPPADFTRKQPGAERLRAVLLHGVPGTAMTAMQADAAAPTGGYPAPRG